MDLSGIIAISGKPGLYKVVAQSPNSIIVENVENKRRMPAFATNKISALEDITMYTSSDDVALGEVMQNIYDKFDGKQALDHKTEISELRKELDTVLKECDHDQVYDSDVRKLYQWYNLLQSAGVLKEKIEEAAEAAKKEKKASDKKSDAKPKADKKDTKKPAKTAAKKKASPKKTSAKPTGKAAGGAPKKTGSQRGK